MTIDDIKRLNYIKYTAFRELVRDPHCIVYCICRFFLQVVWALVNWRGGDLRTREILFLVPSINNQKSVQTIIDRLPENRCTVWGNGLSSWWPYSKVCLTSILYLHLFFKLYMASSREDRKLIRFYYWDFITTCATYRILGNAIKNNPQLRMVVMANDHVPITRSVIELTEKFHVKSLYVQHASVSTAFPPLRFNYSFLDGLESYEKYKTIGNMRGSVFLSGSPRFDAFKTYQGDEKRYDIGIALNELDSEVEALKLCLYLKKHYSDKIVVRPHPGMLTRDNPLFHEIKFIENGFAISNPKKDLSFVFLADIKVMIANESGIHLDAALMGVPSLLYNFSDNEVMDWYSYIKKGLIKKCDSFEAVLSMLDSDYKLPLDVVRYYVASYKTTMDGKVGEMIATFINKEVFDSEDSAFSYMDGLMIRTSEYLEYRS